MIGNSMKRRVLSKLLESEGIDQMTYALAAAENELLTTAVRLEEATGVEHISGETLPTIDERKHALKELLRALASGDMTEMWVADVAPDLLDSTDGVEQYVGMESSKWEAQIERWADAYRDAAPEMSDRDLAGHHIEQTFGVDIDTFEQRVVEFDAGGEAERLFAGNLRAVRETMRRVASRAEGEE